MLHDLPHHYRRALRTWLRFACALVVVALLSGVLFQESAKRLGLDEVDPGLHWGAVQRLALLHGRVGLSLAASGGFHRVEDLVKGIMAGADAIQVCSVLLRKGPGVMQDLVRGLSDWLDEQAYASVAQMRGSVSQLHAIDPEAYERLNYVRLMQVAGRQPPRGD